IEHLAVVGNARQHPLRELRKLDELPAVAPLRDAAEAVHALRDVGLKADARLLAIIGAVDAHLGLFRHHMRHARLLQLLELRPIDRPSLLLVDQHGPERLAAGNAAGVRRQDTVAAALHRGLPPCGSNLLGSPSAVAGWRVRTTLPSTTF